MFTHYRIVSRVFHSFFIAILPWIANQVAAGTSTPRPPATLANIGTVIALNASGATNMTVSASDTNWYSFEVPSVPPVPATKGQYVTILHMYDYAWVTETRWEPGTRAQKGQYRCRLMFSPVSVTGGAIWIAVYSSDGAAYRRRYCKKVTSTANIKFNGKADTTYYVSVTPATTATATYSATFWEQVLRGGKPTK